MICVGFWLGNIEKLARESPEDVSGVRSIALITLAAGTVGWYLFGAVFMFPASGLYPGIGILALMIMAVVEFAKVWTWDPER